MSWRRRGDLTTLAGFCLLALNGCPFSGGQGPLPEVDSCPAPQQGTLSLLEIGPGGSAPFRPFEFGEKVQTVRGGQGLNMINVRIRLSGPESPACIKVRIGEVERTKTTESLEEVALKTYAQPDGSRVTKDYWQIVHRFPWTRLAVEAAGQRATIDLQDEQGAVLVPPGKGTYSTLELRGLEVETLCGPDPFGQALVVANSVDAVVAWRQGKLLGVLKPGLAQRTKPAGLTTCSDVELISVAPCEGPPDDKVAGVGIGALTGVIGGCSVPTDKLAECDGKGPAVELHTGDQIDVVRGPLYSQGLLKLRLQPTDGGVPVEALMSDTTRDSYLAVP